MNDDRLAQLREVYKNRNLLEELSWGAYNNHSGYVDKISGEFLNWLCNMAYRQIKSDNQVLEDIRAEIEQFAELGDVGFTRNLIPKDIVLGILDKYKAESEPQESEDT